LTVVALKNASAPDLKAGSSAKAASPSRKALSVHQGALSELNAKIADLQHQAGGDPDRDVVTTEQALRDHLFEAELGGDVDQARRAELRQAVISARQRADGARAQQHELAQLHRQLAGVADALNGSVADVVLEEGIRLADRLYRSEAEAYALREALDRLQRSAMATADRTGLAAHRDVSVRLQERLRYGADPADGLALKQRIIEAGQAYAAQWFGFPDALAQDADFTIADPQVQ